MEPIPAAVDNYRTPPYIVEELTLEDKSINRYVWYPGEDMPWPEIKGGFIRRCRVTAIVPFRIWERIADVPEDMRKSLRRDMMDRDHQEAQYEIPAKGIFESIMEQYGVLGVRELTALQGMKPEDVCALGVDDVFCPWPEDCSIDDMPKSYRVIEDHIRLQLGTLNGNRILKSVGEDMLRSIKDSRKYDAIFVDRVESQKEPIYSNPAFRALSRLDRRRRDHALNDMAAAQNKVFDKVPEILAAQGSSDNSALIGVMQEQNAMLREELAQNREMMKALLAERQADKPSRTRKPAQVDA